MPHFRWRGVTIDGRWRSGRACASDPEQLIERMLKRGIAVTRVRPLRLYHFWQRVSGIEQAQSLETIVLLLESGMPLAQACVVAAETMHNPLLQECWITLAATVDRGAGIADHQVLNNVFGPFIAHLLILSYHAGTFATTACVCAQYARASYDLRAKLQSALAMPLVTLLFVMGLLWLVFAFLVPSLTALFSQFNATLPWSTRVLLEISELARSLWLLPCVGGAGIIMYLLVRYAQYKGLSMRLVCCLPFVGPLYLQWQRMLFVQALHALLQGGMSLLDALHCIAELMPSSAVRAYAAQIAYDVAGGVTLSNALATHDMPLATPLMVAMVTVGQESNKLPLLLSALADREMTEFLAHLRTMTVMIQPILIVLLGVIVLAVIGAVYMPLINIAQVVQ